MERNTSLFGLARDKTIDAGNLCNEMRFFNHSENGNVKQIVLEVNGDARIGFFADRDIPAQTEMTFDYKFSVAFDSSAHGLEAPEASGSRKRKGEPTKKPGAKKKKKGQPKDG